MRRSPVLLALALAVAACGGDDSARRDGRGAGADGAGGGNLPPYREAPIENPGVVRGVVEVEGGAPRDSTVLTTSDQRVCGERFVDQTMVRSGDRLAQAVVWLDGIRAGKAPPITRRFEVTNRRCALEPRVQAVLVGGTLNVKSADPVLHRTRVLDARTGRTLALVRQNDDGQVVPVEEVLNGPRRLELRCDLHPWTRGWIQVFDHPYFATTDRDGTFRIDGVPPGHYTLRAWHERLGALARRVRVEAGRDVSVELEF